MATTSGESGVSGDACVVNRLVSMGDSRLGFWLMVSDEGMAVGQTTGYSEVQKSGFLFTIATIERDHMSQEKRGEIKNYRMWHSVL